MGFTITATKTRNQLKKNLRYERQNCKQFRRDSDLCVRVFFVRKIFEIFNLNLYSCTSSGMLVSLKSRHIQSGMTALSTTKTKSYLVQQQTPQQDSEAM